MFSCLAKMLGRVSTLTSSVAAEMVRPQLNLRNSRLLPINQMMPMVQVRWFKDKYILKLRCKDCYFKKIDDRWWVLCQSKPRHKQRQRIDDIRKNWIVTHITRGGPNKYFPFRKHFQYPGHDL